MLSTLSSTSDAGTAVMNRVDRFTESLKEGGLVADAPNAPLAPSPPSGGTGEEASSCSAYRTVRGAFNDALVGRDAFEKSYICGFTPSSGVYGEKSSSPAVIKSSIERWLVMRGATGGSIICIGICFGECDRYRKDRLGEPECYEKEKKNSDKCKSAVMSFIIK